MGILSYGDAVHAERGGGRVVGRGGERKKGVRGKDWNGKDYKWIIFQNEARKF